MDTKKLVSLNNNHKKLAILHLIIGVISLSFSVLVFRGASEGFGFQIGVFLGLANIIIAVACWLKIEFFRQVSLFLSITILFPTIIGIIVCAFFSFPYAQWSDTSEQPEKTLFYALLWLPFLLTISIVLFT